MDEIHNNRKHAGENEYDELTNDRLIQDHEYDGIRELDNDLPPWLKWIFYLSISFAAVYLIRFFVLKSDDLYQEREFKKEMATAAMSLPPERTAGLPEMTLLTDQASLLGGRSTYEKICSVCHLTDGGGLVGPNFTDDYWIHGNTVEDMYAVISNGIIEKGMIAYKDQLSPKQILEVIGYIATLRGTVPAKPKAPEGELLDWPY